MGWKRCKAAQHREGSCHNLFLSLRKRGKHAVTCGEAERAYTCMLRSGARSPPLPSCDILGRLPAETPASISRRIEPSNTKRYSHRAATGPALGFGGRKREALLACTHRKTTGKNQIYLTKAQARKWLPDAAADVRWNLTLVPHIKFPIGGAQTVKELRTIFRRELGDDHSKVEAWVREHLHVEVRKVRC